MSLLFFPQVCRLALVERVLEEAARTNLWGSGGRSFNALTQCWSELEALSSPLFRQLKISCPSDTRIVRGEELNHTSCLHPLVQGNQ